MFEKIKTVNLFNTEKTIAVNIFENTDYPWEVLEKIGDFIINLGKTLTSDKFDCPKENVWIAKSCKISSLSFCPETNFLTVTLSSILAIVSVYIFIK